MKHTETKVKLGSTNLSLNIAPDFPQSTKTLYEVVIPLNNWMRTNICFLTDELATKIFAQSYLSPSANKHKPNVETAQRLHKTGHCILRQKKQTSHAVLLEMQTKVR